MKYISVLPLAMQYYLTNGLIISLLQTYVLKSTLKPSNIFCVYSLFEKGNTHIFYWDVIGSIIVLAYCIDSGLIIKIIWTTHENGVNKCMSITIYTNHYSFVDIFLKNEARLFNLVRVYLNVGNVKYLDVLVHVRLWLVSKARQKIFKEMNDGKCP